MSAFFRKVRWLARRREKEAEIQEELQFHLEEEADERREQGLGDQEARWAARRSLGNPALVKEDTRAEWSWPLVEQLAQDIRYACRTMAANRAFTLLAAASLALGIGSNTAIFSFMDSIMLRSLPVADPESLVVLNWHAKAERRDSVIYTMSGSSWGNNTAGVTSGMFPYPAFELFQKNDAVFSSVFGHFCYWPLRSLNLTIKGHAEIARGWNVTGDYFRGLGVQPAAGRLIAPADDVVGAPAIAVVSYGFSQRRFGGAAEAVSQTVLINNLPFTVAGVTPPEFFGVDPAEAPDIFLPLHTNELLGAGHQFGFRPEDYLDQHYYWIQIMGRLRPGVSLAQAQAVLGPQFHRWVEATANERERTNLPELVVREGASGLDTLRREYSKPLYVLLTLVGLILGLSCANVANLLLARSAARRREIALRLSLGAGRFRIARQLLTESVLLAMLGGVAGLLLAAWGMRSLTLLLANGEADFTLRAEMNWHVLGVTAVLSALTGVLFGLAPALEATRGDLVYALKATAPGRLLEHGYRKINMRRLLMMGQMAISLVMLVAAGLFVRTLENLESVNLGFNRQNVLLFEIDARKAGHKDPEIEAFYADLRNQFSRIPGVRSASLSNDSLIDAGSARDISVPGSRANMANRYLMAGPDFFETMQIPILAGRGIEGRDHAGAPAVAVINEAFAKANLSGRNPLGQHLVLWEAEEGKSRIARDMEIVGISRNARYGGLTRAIPPVVYMPYDQGFPQPEQIVYALRTSGDPLRYVSAVREIVGQADARVPVTGIRTQVADIDRTINQQIVFAQLCTGFAILALTIACVGLYGTVSYNVARRTSEIGIRMALGARATSVVRMVLGEVLALAAAGLAIGLAAALGTTRFVASFLFGMKANDPLTLAVAGAILLGAAVLAGYVPARKASRIDPMAALRHE